MIKEIEKILKSGRGIVHSQTTDQIVVIIPWTASEFELIISDYDNGDFSRLLNIGNKFSVKVKK